MRTEVIPIILTITLAALGAGCASAGRHLGASERQSPQFLEVENKKKAKALYLLYLPVGYEETKRLWPLMLFLHGAGERGEDLEKVKIHGPPKLIATEGRNFPFVIVSPQCPEDGWWSDDVQIEMLDALLSHIVGGHRIDQNRMYITGLSMGGYGTWRLAAEYPDRFAAIAPICGGGDPQDAQKISHLPIWVFHGAKDNVVPLEKSKEMVEALKKAGSKVKFTIYPEAGHDSWTETYDNPELYEWFLKHRRSDNK